MTNHGDDCYFFYYSTCAKGDSCPFRHCEAAMGSEVVCSLWQESRCFRTVCKFRHMEIKKNRKQIACYWENQPAGCQKPHCAFHHEKPRFIDGVWVPANKGSALNDEEEPQEDPSPPAPTPLPTAANPQLRGVIKAETQENVPSPTHPPVVINPADDEDEDEDDQFSEEGEDSKTASDGSRLVSPRKMSMSSSSDESLNFGIRTLEEIRLRKALKASMRRSGHPIGQGSDSAQRNNGVSGEKENIRSFVRPSLYLAKDDPVIFGEETGRRNVAERLGKRIIEKDDPDGGDMPLKRRLAERLGRKVDEEDTDPAPQKALKPVRDRLGLPAEPTVIIESAFIKAETNSEAKASEEIRIKTLEEIRQEKAAKSQGRKDNTRGAAPDTTSPTTRASKRVITVKPASNSQKKTFSEVLHARKKLEEEQHQGQSLRKARQPAKEAPDNSQASTDTAMPSRVTPPRGGVRVKTLDEIRKEKAARMQARVKEAANGKSPVSGPEVGEGKEVTKKPRIMRINKPASPATASTTTQKTAEVTEKPAEPTANVVPEPSPANGRSDLANKSLKVKTFEEIMREKRLRKQQLQEEQASSTSQSDVSAKAKPAEKAAPGSTLVREKSVTPIRVKVTPPNLSSPSSPTLTIEAPTLTLEAPTQAPQAPIRQRITLKPKAASPVPSVATSPQQGSPLRQAEADSPSLSPRSSTAAPGKRKRGPLAASASKQAKGASSPGPSAEEPPVEKTQDGAQRKSPGQVTETKVRPKLNVKPSVMKPAAQVKPGQKRRAAESPRSAVAAVKPLNSASMAQDEQLQEPTCKRRGVSSPSSSTDAQMSPLVPRSPPTLLGHGPGSSPLREELQTVPVIEHSTAAATPAVTTTSDMAARESCVVPQSPTAVKTPTQPRPRRTSVVTSSHPTTASTSTMDDFDELMNEFTDDRLEDEMELDPGKGEDDLLLELSEMIDS